MWRGQALAEMLWVDLPSCYFSLHLATSTSTASLIIPVKFATMLNAHRSKLFGSKLLFYREHQQPQCRVMCAGVCGVVCFSTINGMIIGGLFYLQYASY